MSDDELLARLALTDRNCACPGCKVRRDAAARIRAQAQRIAELEDDLLHATSIGMATIVARCERTPYLQQQYDELEKLHAKCDAAFERQALRANEKEGGT